MREKQGVLATDLLRRKPICGTFAPGLDCCIQGHSLEEPRVCVSSPSRCKFLTVVPPPCANSRRSHCYHSAILPHLQFTATAYEKVLDDLSSGTRLDLALTLLEASRFPYMEWKRISTSQAAKAMAGVENSYLTSRFASAKSMLCRLDQQHEAVVQAIQTYDPVLKQPAAKNQMKNSAVGFALLQQALN